MSFPPVLPPQPPVISVELDPVPNILNSMTVLTYSEHNPGVSTWLREIEQAMPSEMRYNQRVLFWGVGVETLYNVLPLRDDTEFSDYLARLTAMDAVVMRDNLIHHTLESAQARAFLDKPLPDQLSVVNPLEVDEHEFVAHKIAQTQLKLEKQLDPSVYATAYHLFHHPAELHKTVVAHLDALWTQFMADDWARTQPILQEVVTAFRPFELSGLPIFEAMRAVTGRYLHTILDEVELQSFQHIRFVPSPHNGPYLTCFGDAQVLRMFFGARMPAGVRTGHSVLDNAQLLNRLNALADDMRLQILFALRDAGELGTGQIMEQFDLNKSAASRHLRSLHASGLIVERREDDNKRKFYSVNADSLREVVQALSALMTETVR